MFDICYMVNLDVYIVNRGMYDMVGNFFIISMGFISL